LKDRKADFVSLDRDTKLSWREHKKSRPSKTCVEIIKDSVLVVAMMDRVLSYQTAVRAGSGSRYFK
jgi:hypothetical protein